MIPVVGSGLWGPIWGYVALKVIIKLSTELNSTIKLRLLDLGAEIKEDFLLSKV